MTADPEKVGGNSKDRYQGSVPRIGTVGKRKNRAVGTSKTRKFLDEHEQFLHTIIRLLHVMVGSIYSGASAVEKSIFS